eukprot:TRINITY_DN5127_c0_g1_i1.p1 TRINITY_DN5127_c0_g1~~TRINITY_DN5127_c0_g1_i1.p1  ORF type:complete len:550 (+),score=182.18 TRINITY_DN5127_c0_g1_i1:76-1725(+)
MEEPPGAAEGPALTPNMYHGAVRGMLRRMEVEVAGLEARDEICLAEESEAFVLSEMWWRSLCCAKDLQVRLGMCRELEIGMRDEVYKSECLDWEKLCSRFLQIGIPRKNIALAGVLVRASPSVDARKTLRQVREGTVVVVEEVAGNWARVSSPVKGWVWRTHLKPIEEDDEAPDSPTSLNELTPGLSSESFPPVMDCAAPPAQSALPRPTRYSSDYFEYHRPARYSHDQESRSVRYSCDGNDYPSQDDDSLFGLRPTIVHGSIGGTTSRNQNLSDNDYLASSLTKKNQDPKHFSAGDRVKMRDAPNAYWAWGQVKRVANDRVFIQRDGFPGMACWKYFTKVSGHLGDRTKQVEVVREANEALGLDLDHDKLTVQNIDDGSPAKSAGLRVGMKVVKIDQMSVSSMLDVRLLLKKAGERLMIGVLDEPEPVSATEASSDGGIVRDLDDVTSMASTTTVSNALSSPKLHLTVSGCTFPARGDGYGYIPLPAALCVHRSALLALHWYAEHDLPARLGITIPKEYLNLVSQFLRLTTARPTPRDSQSSTSSPLG